MIEFYHLAELQVLDFYFSFIDKYIDRTVFELLEMDTDSNFLHSQKIALKRLSNLKGKKNMKRINIIIYLGKVRKYTQYFTYMN